MSKTWESCLAEARKIYHEKVESAYTNGISDGDKEASVYRGRSIVLLAIEMYKSKE